MQQEINFYALLPKAEKEPLGITTILILYGLFLILLIFNYAYKLTEKNSLLDRLQLLNVELIKQKKQLNEVLEKYPLINPDDLQGSMVRLKANITAKSKLVYALAAPVKFSEYLNALDHTDMTGAWLTNFIINKNGLEVDLTGQSLTPANVNAYYERLKQQSYFSTMKFEITNISNPDAKENTDPTVQFTISGKANTLYEE